MLLLLLLATTALALRSSACSLIGEANEFLISGLGVICIDTKYLPPELALGLTRGEPTSFFLLAWVLMFFCRIAGTDVSFVVAAAISTTVVLVARLSAYFSVLGSCCRLATVLFYLQIMVFTMKLPDTDFVLVIDLAARRNTFDFFTDRVLFSFEVDCSSTLEVLALHWSDPGLCLKGFLRCSEIGMATVS